MSSEFPARLSDRMKALELNDDQLAGRICDAGMVVQSQTIRRWRLGLTKPRGDYMPVLTHVLRCHLEDLMPLPRPEAVH